MNVGRITDFCNRTDILARAISVSKLNDYIRDVFLAEEMLHNIEVEGEIDGLKQWGDGVFFSLKDNAAVISCSCFNALAVRKLREVKNGAQIVVRGTVSYQKKDGRIRFSVYSCEASGIGQLFLKLEELKKRLEAEGLFSGQKQMPSEVKRIGVVTSRAGAVLHDIIKVAHRRNPNVDIVLYSTAVQGDNADTQICEGIDFFSACGMVDVVIVARGGGSREDLAAFNSECIARSVFACKVPVVSAVGHETDWTLIDLVAIRAPTPSAAAEMVVREVKTEREAVLQAYRHLRFALKSKIERIYGRIAGAWVGAKNAIKFKMGKREGDIQTLAARVDANNPLAVLRRGYAKVYKGKELIIDIERAEIGDKLDIKMYNGTIGAEVIWTKKLPK